MTEVHFFCKQTNTEAGLGERLLADAGAREYVHDYAGELSQVRFEGPVIFDLCLDLFNRSNMWATGISGPTTKFGAFSSRFARSLSVRRL